MTARIAASAVAGAAVVFCCGTSVPIHGQRLDEANPSWVPPHLADGQPDITGVWNSVAATHTPLELPTALAGRNSYSPDELQALVNTRAAQRTEPTE